MPFEPFERVVARWHQHCKMILILILVVQCWRQEGDFYVFNSGLVHEVPAVVGDAKARIVLATFIGYSDDDGARTCPCVCSV